jgi:predicted RecB family nuclease
MLIESYKVFILSFSIEKSPETIIFEFEADLNVLNFDYLTNVLFKSGSIDIC